MLLACGGLDEDLPAMDDFELGLRLWKRGVRFQYLPGAVAYELSGENSAKFRVYRRRRIWQEQRNAQPKAPRLSPALELLAGLGRTAWWKRFLRRVTLQFPVSPAHLLMPPFWVCEKLCHFPIAQKKGLRLLEIGRRIEELRAALKETGSWKNFHDEFEVSLPVLMYHHVGPLRPGTLPSLTVSPERFEKQVRELARRGYQGICPTDWIRWRLEGKKLPDKPVLLTFDDGYADLVEHALPVLGRYGFGAAVYIVTGQLDGTNTWDEARGSGTHRLMTREQIRYWVGQGIEFGAHSRTHADLTTLAPHELTEEVVGSGNDLESLLGTRVSSFAYPYGFHNQAVDDCVRGAYDLAFLAEDKVEGLNHLLTDPIQLRRTMVQASDSVWEVVDGRARWGLNPVERLRHRLRLRSRFKDATRFVFGRSRSS